MSYTFNFTELFSCRRCRATSCPCNWSRDQDATSWDGQRLQYHRPSCKNHRGVSTQSTLEICYVEPERGGRGREGREGRREGERVSNIYSMLNADIVETYHV